MLEDGRSLGRSLRIWRTLNGVKQSHAAELLKVSQGTISRWESGMIIPDDDEAAALRDLLGARLDSAADFALARLVERSTGRVHLVCDLSHRLLAASRGRMRGWGLSFAELHGRSLWRYATPEIVAAEARLRDRGWFERRPPSLQLETGANRSNEVPIEPSTLAWTRLQLSDGSFARLAETLE
jgi:transcriptional regulator with XRE-family HTH domain